MRLCFAFSRPAVLVNSPLNSLPLSDSSRSRRQPVSRRSCDSLSELYWREARSLSRSADIPDLAGSGLSRFEGLSIPRECRENLESVHISAWNIGDMRGWFD